MAEGSATSADDEPRHGFFVGDIGVLIPRATRSQYLPNTSVYPVPRATPRLRGLIHWRGQAVVAIDADQSESTELPVIGVCDLLLIGTDNDAVALLQSAPPRVVHLRGAEVGTTPKPDFWLAEALTESRVDTSEREWWELDLGVLVQCMHGTHLTQGSALDNTDD
jgi:hypothetical protein